MNVSSFGSILGESPPNIHATYNKNKKNPNGWIEELRFYIYLHLIRRIKDEQARRVCLQELRGIWIMEVWG